MDLGKMINVLWARRGLVAIGILVGVVASFLAINAVKVSMNADKPFFSYSPRVQTVYSTTVRMVLDEPSFGLGRVGILGPDERRQDRDLSKLAAVYAYMVVSDEMISGLTRDIKSVDGEVKAVPVEGLPIIEVSVEGNDPAVIRNVASKTTANFIDYFKNEQIRNEVPASDRIIVRTIGEPSSAVTEQSRRKELAFVFFVFPIACAALLAFAMENLKNERVNDSVENKESNKDSKENNENTESESIMHRPKPVKRTV